MTNAANPSAIADASRLAVGDTLLNLYEITALLGEGGMGKVYKALHRGWNMELAIKTAKPAALEKKGGIDKFEQEAETWVNLGLHPHIVCCYYVRRLEACPLLFAEFVSGGSLKSLITHGKITTVAQALDIAIQFAWGLHYAHQHGLVHRDVKPDNVMMTPQGLAKVTDFGLAITHNIKSELEESSSMTVVYASLEQTNQEPLTPKTDMWSWGLSVLEIFKGKVNWPFGAMAASILEGYLDEANPPLKMPDALVKLLQQCFERNPADRPADMGVVAQALIAVYRDSTGRDYPRQCPDTSLDKPDNLNNRAVSLLDLHKTAEAMALWKKSLAQQPHHLEALYNTGIIAWRNGKLTDESLLRRLQSAQQSSAGAWVNAYLQALIHLERDDSVQALQLLNDLPPDIQQRGEVTTAITQAQQREASGQQRRLKNVFAVENLAAITSLSLRSLRTGLFAASLDGTIKRWLGSHSEQTYTLHEGQAVLSVSVSHSGDFALSGGADQMAKQWLTTTGQLLYGIKHTAKITCVCISPDDQFALSAGADRVINLWRAANGEPVGAFLQHQSPVCTANFSNQGQWVASGDEDGNLWVWETTTLKVIFKQAAHQGAVTALAWFPKDQFILTAGADGLLKLWERTTSRCVAQYAGHTQAIQALQVTANGHYALSAGDDKTIRIWDIRRRRCLRTFSTGEVIQALALPPGHGHQLLSGGSEWVIKRWQVNLTEQPFFTAPPVLAQVVTSETALNALQIYQRALQQAQQAVQKGQWTQVLQQLMLARSQPGYAREADTMAQWYLLYTRLPKTGLNSTWQHNILESEQAVTAISFSPTADYLWTATAKGQIQQWDMHTATLLYTWHTSHRSGISALAISPDGDFILAAGKNGAISLWQLPRLEKDRENKKEKKERFIKEWTGHLAAITHVCFFKNNANRFLSASEDQTVRLWDIPAETCLRIYPSHHKWVLGLDISADDEFFLSCGNGATGKPDNTAKLWQISTGRCVQVLRGHESALKTVLFTPDGQVAITGSHDHQIRVWKLASGECVRCLSGHQGPITSLCLSADGRFLASGSQDKAVKLWDLYTAQCLYSFPGHAKVITQVLFSADSQWLLSASEDKTIQVWQLDWHLEATPPQTWSWMAKPWLDAFCNAHRPYLGPVPATVTPDRTGQPQYLTRQGEPQWTAKDLKTLYTQLGYAGFGWLMRQGIEQQLAAMITRPPTVLVQEEAFDCPRCNAAYQRRPHCLACGQVMR